LLPGNESRIVRRGTAQKTVVLAKSTKLKHGTKLGRTLCYAVSRGAGASGRGGRALCAAASTKLDASGPARLVLTAD